MSADDIGFLDPVFHLDAGILYLPGDGVEGITVLGEVIEKRLLFDAQLGGHDADGFNAGGGEFECRAHRLLAAKPGAGNEGERAVNGFFVFRGHRVLHDKKAIALPINTIKLK
ncbi:hypothetical protein DESC_810120 [Desulfosarcina cetonica]|nr:hypothetical protein DESC_810120 [Desulfosarcina cetonica]